MQPEAIFFRDAGLALNDVEAAFTLLFICGPGTCFRNATKYFDIFCPTCFFLSLIVTLHVLSLLTWDCLSTMNLYSLRPMPRLAHSCSLSHTDRMIPAGFTFPTCWPRVHGSTLHIALG